MNRNDILREMGLGPVWKLRATPPQAPAEPVAVAAAVAVEAVAQDVPVVAPIVPIVPIVPAAPAAAMDWDELAATVAACRQCRLCETRKQAVLGVGDRNADWLFVGEGPGAEEDERGEPFVGQAGKLLDNMLAAIGLKRGEDVYIANAVKCRPPENRTPAPEEAAACKPWLERQIELIQPKLIVALGRPAAQTLLQAEVKIAAARGKLHDYRGIPVIVTYHPAYLLRTLPDKARAWEDLCFMKRTMQERKSG
ncbi:MAG: uracil-DNA glycosylase [Sulfuritalea sp.]